MLYLGVATLVIGIGLFVRHAFQNEWITEWMRVAIGSLAGIGLLVGGRTFVGRGYRLYGQMLSGGGLAALYLTTYAALNFYSLIGRGPAFAILIGITAMAALLAEREQSPGLALAAVVGGFATPFMVGGDTDAQLTLFTYVAVLIAGTMYLARGGMWPMLHAVSLALTWLTVASWAARFYLPDTYLATELFLTLFCAMFLFIQRQLQHSPHGLAPAVSRFLWAAPGLYHLASLAILVSHSIAFLIYLIAFSLAGLMGGARRAAAWVRLLLWSVVAIPFYGWLVDHTGSSWFVEAMVSLWAIYSLHLAAQVETLLREEQPLPPADIALLHANGLWLYGGMYALLEPRFFSYTGLAAALLAAIYWASATTIGAVNRNAALHFRMLAFTLAAGAAVVQFDGPWVTVLWAAEAVGIIRVGLQERRDWVRAAGAFLFGVAIIQLFQLQLAPVASSYRVLWNERVGVTMLIAALLGVTAWLHQHATAWVERPPSTGAGRAEPADGRSSMASGPAFAVASAEARRSEPFDSGHPESFDSVRPEPVEGRSTAQGKPGQRMTFAQDRPVEPRSARDVAAAILTANVLIVILLTMEINAFFLLRAARSGAATTAELARQVAISVTWAAYAAGLVGAGFQRRYAPIRYLAIVLFGLTLLKVFTVDLSRLDSIYRIVSSVGLGVLLVAASYLYHRFRSQLSAQEP